MIVQLIFFTKCSGCGWNTKQKFLSGKTERRIVSCVKPMQYLLIEGLTHTHSVHVLYNICQIRKFLSLESTKTLVHAFLSSHLDYSNSLLFGLPKYQTDRLKNVLNAAQLIFKIPKFDHIFHCIGLTQFQISQRALSVHMWHVQANHKSCMEKRLPQEKGIHSLYSRIQRKNVCMLTPGKIQVA